MTRGGHDGPIGRRAVVTNGRRHGTALRIAAVLALVGVVAAGCGDGAATPGDPGDLRVVATTSILGDVVAEVVGERATVESLMPPGVDPHDFSPSPAQVAALNQADLVVANGLGLEEGMEDVIESAEADGANVLEVAPRLDPIPFGHDAAGECDPEAAHAHEDDAAHGDEAAGSEETPGCDPHVWMDPLRMARAAGIIAEALGVLDPDTDWIGAADTYGEELAAADADIERTLEALLPERRKLVTSHESFGYFADRYGFEVVGVVVPGGSTTAEPSSQELAGLVEVVEAEGVPAIFTEIGTSSVLADAVAAEAGDVAVVELFSDALGEPGSGADSLIGLLTTNAERIAGALE